MGAQRLFGSRRDEMRYDLVPTTVFTPLEYGCVGLSEEEAYARFTAALVRVYHSPFTPYDYKLDPHDTKRSYAKIVCVLSPKVKPPYILLFLAHSQFSSSFSTFVFHLARPETPGLT